MKDYRLKIIQDDYKICMENYSRLNEWETKFIDSIKDFMHRGAALSNNQFNKLQDIAEKLK